MGVTVHINHEAEIDEIVSRFPCLSILKKYKNTKRF